MLLNAAVFLLRTWQCSAVVILVRRCLGVVARKRSTLCTGRCAVPVEIGSVNIPVSLRELTHLRVECDGSTSGAAEEKRQTSRFSRLRCCTDKKRDELRNGQLLSLRMRAQVVAVQDAMLGFYRQQVDRFESDR